ncbi:hypothetical protein Trydic_g21816 [Trypoxylus dichotomus]
MSPNEICTFLLRCLCIPVGDKRREEQRPAKPLIGASERTSSRCCKLNLAEESAIIAAMNVHKTTINYPPMSTTFVCLEEDV